MKRHLLKKKLKMKRHLLKKERKNNELITQ
jgi:hypothetical protein